MMQRRYVPPQPHDRGITVRVAQQTTGPLAALLDAVRAIRSDMGVPIQVLRSDRIMSWTHLSMAAVHAERAADDRRMRASDPAVEFLLYAACDRQIHRAVDALGVQPDGTRSYAVVALRPVRQAALAAALQSAGVPEGASWSGEADARDPASEASARSWWQERLDVADPAAVEGALLAQMALLALDRA